MGKITIKHHLNKRLKPSIGDNSTKKYPVYVRVIYNRNNTNFRSEIITKTLLSEYELDNDKQVKQEIEYERNIIEAIIKYGTEKRKESFSINTRLPHVIQVFNKPVSWDFFSIMLDKELVKEVRENIKNFLHEKTGLSKESTNYFVEYFIRNRDFTTQLVVNELIKFNVIPAWQTKIYKYGFSLDDYEIINFGDNREKYGANKNFNFYEWEFNHGKDKFLKFITEKNLLTIEDINQFIDDYENGFLDHFNAVIEFSCLSTTRV